MPLITWASPRKRAGGPLAPEYAAPIVHRLERDGRRRATRPVGYHRAQGAGDGWTFDQDSSAGVIRIKAGARSLSRDKARPRDASGTVRETMRDHARQLAAGENQRGRV